MKIMKRGTDSDRVFTATCLVCKSEIEARRRELKIQGADDRLTDFKEFGTAKCPACKNLNLIFHPKSPI